MRLLAPPEDGAHGSVRTNSNGVELMTLRTLPLIVVGVVGVVAGVASAQPMQSAESRLFELRTYHTSDGKLDALHARFRDCATRMFEKHGITNLGYWTPADANGSRIVFLLAYPNEAARDASWSGLAIDPDWRKCRRETERDGRLVERIEELLLVPTADCPVVAPTRGEEPRAFEVRTYTTKLDDRTHHHTICEKYREALVGCWTATTTRPSGEVTHVYLLAHDRPIVERQVPDAGLAARYHISTTGGPGPRIRPRPISDDGGIGLVLQPTDYSPLR